MPSWRVFPYHAGEYVVARRMMPTFDLFGYRHDNLPWSKRMCGEVIWVDNQDPPWLCIRREDGKKFRVSAREVSVRYLHGKPS